MSEPNIAVYDEEVFSDELPDEILELAGANVGGAGEFRDACILLRIGHLPSHPR